MGGVAHTTPGGCLLPSPFTPRPPSSRPHVHAPRAPTSATHAKCVLSRRDATPHATADCCARGLTLRTWHRTSYSGQMGTQGRTYVLTYLRTCVLAYLRTCELAYLRTYVSTGLCAYVPTYFHAYVLTYLRTYVLTCLCACTHLLACGLFEGWGWMDGRRPVHQAQSSQVKSSQVKSSHWALTSHYVTAMVMRARVPRWMGVVSKAA